MNSLTKNNSNLPLVSVCIPVFNSQKWLRETLDSALKQTYPNIEIIAVDDGSTDNSWNILQEYKTKFPTKIKIFRQENKGACAARNRAFIESTGDYIQWLDADDIIENDKLEQQLRTINFVKNTDMLLSGSFSKFYNKKNKSEFKPNSLWTDLTPDEWLRIYLKESAVIYPHCWLVSREIISRAGQWDEKILLNQDGEYFSRVVANSSYIKFVQDSKSYYRTGNLSSISNNKSKKKIISLIEANLQIVENVLNFSDISELKEACCLFLQKFYSNILYEDKEIPEIETLKQKICLLGGSIPSKNYSTKFKIIKEILGLSLARKLKLFFWSLEIKLRKFIDYFF